MWLKSGTLPTILFEKRPIGCPYAVIRHGNVAQTQGIPFPESGLLQQRPDFFDPAAYPCITLVGLIVVIKRQADKRTVSCRL